MFSRHFQSELSFLREMGRRFSQAHPNTAGMLAEAGQDPDVERLMEGFAFLFARVRERLDREVPEVIQELCTLALPHYLRSIPSCSVAEFSPDMGALRGRETVPAGAELATAPIAGTACRFRTAWPVQLLPLAVEGASLEGAQSQSPLLRVAFRSSSRGAEAAFDDAGLRLFLHGEFAVATTLWLWLLRHCREVTVRSLSGSGQEVALGPEVLRPVGLAPSEALLPWPRLAPDGYRLLQEYFTVPQKFLFVDVGPLAAARAAASERFELAFRFDRPPELPGRVSPGAFRLHCAPVVNLFAASAEPILSELPGAEHLLRPSGVAAAHAEVYSVESVQGLRTDGPGRARYEPFAAYEHALPGAARRGYFRLRRELSPARDGLDAHLSVSTPRDVTPTLAEEVLSVELTCTNRALAGQVRSGDLCAPTPSSPARASFKNLLPATRPVLPPLGAELHARLARHLALIQGPLESAQDLRELLGLYDFQGAADPQDGANRARIAAVLSLEVQPVRRQLDGAALLGESVLVELEEGSFASRGEAFLFGCVLNELLASRVALGSFSELKVRLQPSRTEYVWAPRNGSQVLT